MAATTAGSITETEKTMRSFWGFYDNGTYRVGCNGATIYVYDRNDRELAKFRDVRYAYTGAFQPGKNVFAAKTTEGSLAVYDLDRMVLIKKIRIARVDGQDEGFAFSGDGKFFLNIEKKVSFLETQLTIYRTSDFEAVRELFRDADAMVLIELEIDPDSGECYVLGFMRDAHKVFEYGFVGKLTGEEITEIKRLDRETYWYAQAYKGWERCGFTPKKLEWSSVKRYGKRPPVTLRKLHGKDWNL